MNKNFKLWAGALAVALTTTSCVNDGFGRQDWDTPSLACENKFAEPTMTLAAFVAQAPSTGTITIADEQIIEGYVISSDEHGNFYKTISFQDKPENPTVGLQIEVNKASNYLDFPVGTKIRINAKGLVLGTDRGVIKLGSVDPDYAIGRIAEAQVGNYLSVVCNDGKRVIENIVPLQLPSLATAKNRQYINQLVSVDNVQFSDSDILDTNGVKSFLNFPKADTNRDLMDSSNGTAILRTSQYATFGSEKLPTGSGKISFVVSRYNTTYQMIIRNTNDINFSNARTDLYPAKGGTNLTYLTAGNIVNFTSYSNSYDAFPQYINDPLIGNRYWRVANFGGNKYIQLGFGATGAKPLSRTFFAVPIDFDNMSTLSFDTKDAHYNGNVLNVYYSTDYEANATNPTLVNITSNFAISQGSTSGYAANFTNSGLWTKPSTLTGRGFIIFEYLGGGSLPTTTMQIDNISIQ